MAIAPGSLGFEQLLTSPPAPPAGFCIIYSKTDNILYLKDSSGVEVALGSASAITSLTGEASGTGPGVTTVTISNSAVIGKVLTGFVSGPNSVVLATDTILEAIEKLQGQISAFSGTAVTSLTGDVTGTGPGATTTTVAFVGGETASDVAASVNDTQAATSINTASTIVRRDVSGNFSASTISASSLAATGTVTGSNLSGTNTGDVTVTDTNSVNLTLIAQNVSADVNLSGATLAIDGSGVKIADGGITNTQINASAAIAYSKLNLSNSIVNADIASGAALALNKLASLTASRALESDALGVISPSVVTSTELSYLSGATSNIQTQINSITGSGITSLTGDVTATGPGASVATVAFVGGSSAANVNSATVLANAATDANTFSAIVRRDAGGNISITQVNGVAPEAHASRHLPAGADPITTAAPLVNLDATTTNATGTANSLARSDHSHDISTGAASTIIPDQSNAEGSSANLARADHIHNIPSGIPLQIGTSNSAGTAASFALSDHIHAHGNQTSGSLHAIVTTSVNGFMSSADKQKLDDGTDANTPSTIVERDASGNFSAGQISMSAAQLRGTSFNLNMSANPSATYSLVWPTTQGAAGTYLSNDGSGNLTWTSPLINIDGGTPTSTFVVGGNVNGGTP